MSEESSPTEKKTYFWVVDLLNDPNILKPPRPIAPRIAWEERITLLAAREKGGKSTIASAAAAAVSAGSEFLGSQCDVGTVLIVALEEHNADFLQRLVRFKCDPSRIAVVDPSSDMDLIRAIRKAAEDIKPSLIIWDTLGAFADAITGDTVDPGDGPAWTRIMLEIVTISREYGASLILHHSRKSDGHYRDSTAIGANVDVILEMHGEGAEPRVIKPKSRFEVPETRFVLEGDTFRLIETEKELQERVLAFVKTHPRCSARDVREGVSGRDGDITKAREALVKKGAIVNVGSASSHLYMAAI